MSYVKKPLEELDVMDDFLMNQLASDAAIGEAFCRRLISTLLHREIGKLKISAQKVLPALSPDLRGIRMDVEVEELSDKTNEQEPAVMNLYDVEPHLPDDMDWPRHYRFYQAKIDSRWLKSGETDFSKLPNLYVLTILNKDPFGHDFMMYSIRNKCEEVPEMKYEDGLRFYYFYTDGKKGGSDSIRKLLQYLKDSREENAIDEATKEIHSYVKQVKIQPEVKLAYMRYEEIINYERKEAAKEATEDAIKKIISICRSLNVTKEVTTKQLADKYSLSLLEAEEKVKKYWES